VPSGALADRIGRRTALVHGALLQAVGYACWTVLPGLPGFAAGFVLWGLGGALGSEAQEALLHDGLAAVDAQEHYARVQGWVGAAGLVAQVPAAVAATALFAAGGYVLVGWVSVAACLATALLALRLPDAPPAVADPSDVDPSDIDPSDTKAETSYLTTLRIGVAEAAGRPAVRGAVVAFGLLYGLDAFEEYFALVARDLGVATVLVPSALLVIPLVGAVGAALGGPANRLRAGGLAAVLLAAAGVLAATTVLRVPPALAGVALFYGLYRLVLVVADARLQQRIAGPARATVTSVANVVAELPAFAVYAAYAVGGVPAVTVLVAAVALALPVLLGHSRGFGF
jgi:MFS family permease